MGRQAELVPPEEQPGEPLGQRTLQAPLLARPAGMAAAVERAVAESVRRETREPPALP